MSTPDCFRQADKQYFLVPNASIHRDTCLEGGPPHKAIWDGKLAREGTYIVTELYIKGVQPATICMGDLLGAQPGRNYSAISDTDNSEAGVQPSCAPRYSMRRIDQELVSWWHSIIFGARRLSSRSLWMAVLQNIRAQLTAQMQHQSLWQTV